MLLFEHSPIIKTRTNTSQCTESLYLFPLVCVCVSPGWSTERVQEYFLWACAVVKGLRGTNSVLEEKLEELFRQRGVQL